ncbi:MAG: HAD-IA family hydrolase [Chloroflexi bacterium]|nr:HAD-IA family hydrolase [Chloroflexota bacterium]
MMAGGRQSRVGSRQSGDRPPAPDCRPPTADFRLSTVLWDLDGTLVDSIELIVQSYEHVAERHLDRRLAREWILAQIGRPLLACLEELAPGRGGALRETYRAFQHEHHDRLMQPIPGVEAVVAELDRRGYRQGIVTSKSRETSLRALRLFGLDRLIEPTVCVDDTDRHKPDPTPVLLALERLGASASQAIYVGDSVHDVLAGSAAGVVTAAALWGAGSAATLRAARPSLLLKAPADLLPYCRPMIAHAEGQGAL